MVRVTKLPNICKACSIKTGLPQSNVNMEAYPLKAGCLIILKCFDCGEEEKIKLEWTDKKATDTPRNKQEFRKMLGVIES